MWSLSSRTMRVMMSSLDDDSYRNRTKGEGTNDAIFNETQ